ncbi:MAG: hypothetical protein QM756_36600 [Polyangiaceae bacterium]
MFTAIVRADATAIDPTTLRELRDALQLSLVEMKRMIARPEALVVSVRLGDSVSRRMLREIIWLLDKKGCAPRVGLARDGEQQVEMAGREFLAALPL